MSAAGDVPPRVPRDDRRRRTGQAILEAPRHLPEVEPVAGA